jgi:hypothetical protein
MKKFHIALIVLIYGCSNNYIPDWKQRMGSISKDSIYVEINPDWQIADTNTINMDLFRNKHPMTALVQVLMIHKDTLFFVSTYGVKLNDSSITLFTPPEYGGKLLVGESVNGFIKSRANRLSGKSLTWISSRELKIGNEIYRSLTKYNESDFKEIIGNYTERVDKDSFDIILGGP